MWKDPQNPDASVTSKPNSLRNGTVVCKALFADVDRSRVPFLQTPVLWTAYVTNGFGSADRTLKQLALIEVDCRRGTWAGTAPQRPVDNPLSSCMSCHMTAESPQRSPMNPTFQAASKIPPVGATEWMRWFQNNAAGTPFDATAQRTGFSLQLAGGIANFYDRKCTQDGEFVSGGDLCQQSTLPLKLMRSSTPPATVYPVERGMDNQELE